MSACHYDRHLNRSLTFNVVKFDSYSSGTIAASKLAAGSSLGGKYEVVSGDASVDAGISRNFNKDYQYGFFDYIDHSHDCNLNDWESYVDWDYLKQRIAILPKWDQSTKDVITQYRNFFELHGTHIITTASFGSRLSLASYSLCIVVCG